MAKYYTVYDSKDDHIIVFGDAKKCAAELNIKVKSFYFAISRQNKNNGKRKYTIISEEKRIIESE